MTTTLAQDLFLSILAFDSYNRGDRPNMDASATTGGLIGLAEVTHQSPVIALTSGNQSGRDFSATAYDWDGQTVIAYRGTDNPSLTEDIIDGWVIGGGIITKGTQADEAEDFYLEVTGRSAYDYPQPASDVILTGHSLGGGLAAYIGSLSGQETVAFDHMPFSAAAWLAWALESERVTGTAFYEFLIPNSGAVTPVTAPAYGQLEAYYVFGEALAAGRAAAAGASAFAAAFTTLVGSYFPGGSTVPTSAFAGWVQHAADGEAATQYEPPLESFGGPRNAVNLHSMTLAVHLMYARVHDLTEWHTFGPDLWNAFFLEKVGDAVESNYLAEFADGKMTNGYKLGGMLAYSAIADGVKPFGDLAIKVLFDDAGDVGKAMDDAGKSGAIMDLGQSLAEITLQYAGLVAVNKMFDGPAANTEGIIERSADQATLVVDLSDVAWLFPGGLTNTIVGRDSLIEILDRGLSLLSNNASSGAIQGIFTEALTKLHNDPNGEKIDRFVFKVVDDGQAVTLPEPAPGTPADVITYFGATAGDDEVTGSSAAEVIGGGAGDDLLAGGAGNDILVGGSGDDTLVESEGDDFLIGGSGTDKVDYPDLDFPDGVILNIESYPFGRPGEVFTFSQYSGEFDHVAGVETVELTDQPDTLFVTLGGLTSRTTVDMAASDRPAAPVTNLDTVDYSDPSIGYGLHYYYGYVSPRTASVDQYGFQFSGLSEELATVTEASARMVAASTVGYITGTLTENLVVAGADRVVLTDHDDAFLGAEPGTVVETGGGKDEVWVTPDVGIADLSIDDRVSLFGTVGLFGGLRNAESLDPYAWGWGGLVGYGLNASGELVIHLPWWGNDGTEMYILNWLADAVTQAQGGGESQLGPGNIVLAEFDIDVRRLLDAAPKAGYDYYQGWELFGLIIKTMTGWDGYGGGDPLVLDLDGDGIETTKLTSISPRFDIDGDLYAEATALAGRDDGMLVRDINGDGVVNDTYELFGVGSRSGFSVLAALDGNNDGVVSAADDGLADFDGDGVVEATDRFADLKIWRDLDADARTDAGELGAIGTHGIVSISLASTPPAPGADSSNGNRIAAVSTFTRADSSTGTIADVVFDTRNWDSVYQGAPIAITQQAAALPDLGARGTLVSLRQAMSNAPASADAVSDALAEFTTSDLVALKEAVRPVLLAWAEGSPIRLADGSVVSGAAGLTDYHDFTLVYSDVGLTARLLGYDWNQSERVVDVSGQERIETTWTLITGETFVLQRAIGAPAITFEELRSDWMATAARDTPDVVLGERIVHLFRPDLDQTLEIRVADGGFGSTLAPELYGDAYDGRHIRFETLRGQDVAVQERMIGESLAAFVQQPTSTQGAIDAITDLVARIEEGLAIYAVRIGVQGGPISEYFDTIRYDAADDRYHATSDDQLIGVFTELMTASMAQADPLQWFGGWSGFLGHIIPDYDQGAAHLEASYAFLGQNIVAANEAVNPGYSVVEAAYAMGAARFDALEDDATEVPPPESLEDDRPIWLGGAGLLIGSNGGDIYYLDGSDQTLRDSGGADVYIVGQEVGQDVIDDVEAVLVGNKGPDSIRFSHHVAADIEATRTGLDLTLTVRATGETIFIPRQFEGEWPGLIVGDVSDDTGMREIVFRDGEVWNDLDIAFAVKRVDPASTAVIGTPDTDALEGGAGNDSMTGGGDSDLYIIGRGDGHDVIEDNENNELRAGVDIVNLVDGITSDELTFNRIGNSNDVTIGFAGAPNDSVVLKGQFDATYTGLFGIWWLDRVEYLAFDDFTGLSTDDIMNRVLDAVATDGDDTLYGFSRADFLDAGLGNDYVSGGNENDTYVFGRGYGDDIFEDNWNNILAAGEDRVLLQADVRPEDLDLSRVPGTESIKLTIRDTGDSFTLQNQFTAVATGVFGTFYFDQIETLEFDDGAVWSADYLRRRVLDEAGTANDETIAGFATADTIDGRAGNDYLAGGGFSDVYMYEAGYGNDVIYEDSLNILLENEDRVIFRGLNRSDVTVSRDGDALIFTVDATGETLNVIGQYVRFPVGGQWRAVEWFEFADQTVAFTDLNPEDVPALGTAANETVTGSAFDEVVDGGAGNDRLLGRGGSDTYLFGTGSGHDTINDYPEDIRWNTPDRVLFGPGVTTVNVALARDGEDLVIALASGETLRVEEQFGFIYSRIEQFEFADGTIWSETDVRAILSVPGDLTGNDTLVGFDDQPNTLDGREGNDELRGGQLADTYLFGVGYGSDRIVESFLPTGAIDKVQFDAVITPQMLTLSRDGDGLLVTFTGSTDSLRIVNGITTGQVEEFRFADGTVWTIDQILLRLLDGTDGDDRLIGYSGADIIDGKGGSDELLGGFGNDTYHFGLGSGHDAIDDDFGVDTVVFGPLVAPEDLDLIRDGDTLVILLKDGDDSLAIRDYFLSGAVESFRFEDGREWTQDYVRQAVLAQQSTDGADRVVGDFNRDDPMEGGAGDDALVGGGGNDTYIYRRGDGSDLIDDRGITSVDRVFFADYTASDATVSRLDQASSHLRIRFTQSGDEIVVVNGLDPLDTSFVERFEFADGTVWTFADIRARLTSDAIGDGADVVFGFPQADTLDGQGGDDALFGAGGADTYEFSIGGGQDVIGEDGTEADRLLIHGYAPAETTVQRVVEGSNDVVLTFAGTGDRILIRNGLAPNVFQGIEEIRFDDGTVWQGTALAARITGTAASDGDDRIVGTHLAETLAGGLGTDLLIGGGNSDTYVFNRGDGIDTVQDSGAGSVDRVEIRGYTAAEVSVARDHANPTTLILTFAGTSDRLHLVDTLDNSFTNGIEQIAFDGGPVWTMADVRARIVSEAASPDGDTIVGFGLDETLAGGTGGDFLSGGWGSDIYVFNAGDGEDTIRDDGAGSTDRIQINGYLPGDVTLARDPAEPNTLILSFTNPADRLRIVDTLGAGFTNGIEEITFANGTVWTNATILGLLTGAPVVPGNDTHTGTSGPDTLEGGAGDDYMSAGDGGDTYVFTRGDGRDTILEDGLFDADRLVIHGYTPAETQVLRDGNTLVLRFDGTNDEIRVTATLDDAVFNEVEQIVFDDSTVWTIADVRARLLTEAATTGDDTVAGFSSADSLTGGLGDDLLVGGTGVDTYSFARGDGRDAVVDDGFGADRLNIHGYTPAETLLLRDGASLILRFVGTTDEIYIKGTLDNAFSNGIESIVFDDATTWTMTDARERLIAQSETAGADRVVGFVMDDQIEGGRDADVLIGGEGSDTYVYQRGDGADLIDDGGFGDTDVILVRGYDIADATLRRSDPFSNDLIVSFGTDGDRITIIDGLSGGPIDLIERIVFESGGAIEGSQFAALALAGQATDGDEIVTGTGFADTLTGGPGSDVLEGGAGVDTYEYRRGDGEDRIEDQTGIGGLVSILGYTPAEVTVGRSPADQNDLVLRFTTAGDRLVIAAALDNPISGIADIRFADGTVWTTAQLAARVIEEAATDGDDRIWGFSTADALRGGGGDDDLRGRGGADTYHFARGDGRDSISDEGGIGTDTLAIHGYLPDEVALSRLYKGSDTLVVRFAGTDDRVILFNTLSSHPQQTVEQIVFDNGTTWTMSQVVAMLDNNAPVANADATLAAALGQTTVIAEDRLLANDRDADGDALHVVAVQGGPGGTFSLDVNNDIRFVSDGTYVGMTEFTYTVSDGSNGFAEATGSLRVAPPAQPRDDSGLTTPEDTPLVISAAQLLANDVDGDQLDIESVGSAVNGSVTTANNGQIIFTPMANAAGPASFVYTTSNAQGGQASATVFITITAANDAPDAANDSGLATPFNASIEIAAAALLANDSDGDPDIVQALAITAVGSATNGVVEYVGGPVVFTPTPGYSGPASFTYTVSDGVLTDQATVTLSVATPASFVPPVADDVTVTVPESATDTAVLATVSATDGDIGDTLSYAITAGNAAGLFEIGATGEISLVLGRSLDYETAAQHILTVTVTDTHALSDAAMVTITVAAPDGSDGDNTLFGGAGPDTFYGGAGNDTLHGNDGDDSLYGGTGNDTLSSDGGLNYRGNNRLEGGDGNDVLIGGSAYDALDTAYYVNATGSVVVDLAAGTATGQGNDTLFSIESVVGSGFADTMSGNNAANTLAGGGGNDTVDGRAGDDQLDGGTGNDVLYGGLGNDSVTGGAGADTFYFTSTGHDIFADFNPGEGDVLRYGFIGAQSVTVTALGNVLQFDVDGVLSTITAPNYTWSGSEPVSVMVTDGSEGDNTLFGGNGADTFFGGAGNDTLYGGDGNDSLYGGTGDDILSSDGGLNYRGNNRLEGGDGNDVLIGGPAFDALDTASYVNATGSVIVDLVAGTATGQGNDTLFSIESAAGSGFADTISGSTAANTLAGGGGNDTIDGRAGDDQLDGSDGNDVLYGGLGNDTVAGGVGADTFYFTSAGHDTFTDFNPGEGDVLFYGFAGAQSVTVTALGNVLQFNVDGVVSTITAPSYAWSGSEPVPVTVTDGSEGDNTLFGGNGADTFYGGLGNDVLTGNDGNDMLYGGIGDDILSSDGGANYMGSNRLDGGDGNDVLIGGPAYDALDTAYYVNATGSVVVDLAAGTATGQGTDTLFNIESAVGSGFADTISGSSAANTLAGGGGNDTLSGGGGADLFAYAIGDGDDIITDFDAGQGDRVDLTGVTFDHLGATANIAVLSDGHTITATNGYNWVAGDFI